MKNLPIWFKYGVFGLVYSLIGIILYLFTNDWGEMFVFVIFSIFSWPWFFLISPFVSEGFLDSNIIVMTIGNILTLVLIGLIVGKIKSRKQNNLVS